MSIYIAGKYPAQARLRAIRDRFRRLGYIVTSSWLDEKATDENASEELMYANALRDLQEVRRCEVFILDTLDESVTGGREVELGEALSLTKDLILVGPKRNIFHYLFDTSACFPNWDLFWRNSDALVE